MGPTLSTMTMLQDSIFVTSENVVYVKNSVVSEHCEPWDLWVPTRQADLETKHCGTQLLVANKLLVSPVVKSEHEMVGHVSFSVF